MKQAAADAYLADTSGTRHEPIPGSTPGIRDRISYQTHENLVSGLLKEGLDPATDRFRNSLQESFKELDVGHDWAYMPDMMEFFQHHHGTALIRTLFGDELLLQQPDFIPKLWQYDAEVLSLAQGLPRLWRSNGYRVRDRLIAAVQTWQANATSSPNRPSHEDNSHSDPVWGTKMMRQRYEILLNATGQDETSVASTNLAFIWTYVKKTPVGQYMPPYIFFSQCKQLLFDCWANHVEDPSQTSFLHR